MEVKIYKILEKIIILNNPYSLFMVVLPKWDKMLIFLNKVWDQGKIIILLHQVWMNKEKIIIIKLVHQIHKNRNQIPIKQWRKWFLLDVVIKIIGKKVIK
jgi:hypothetical protein